MYYRDPDNNRVELQIDNFETPAELDGYFHSRAFAENPVGVTYYPEELCCGFVTLRGSGQEGAEFRSGLDDKAQPPSQ
jgi:hypothetical protein